MTQKDKEIIENFLNKKEPVIELFEVQAIASMMYEICKRFEKKRYKYSYQHFWRSVSVWLGWRTVEFSLKGE